MADVSWSPEAEADLEVLVADPAVRNQLRRNARRILHVISPVTADRADEGFNGEIMWHRGSTSEDQSRPERADGPQNYFLFYRRQPDNDLGFEVLAVRSINQIASRWEQMHHDTADLDSLEGL